MHFVKGLAISLLTATALLAPAAVAAAESVTVPDRRGDAPRGIDVTRVRVDNGQHAVRIHLHFADLHSSRVRKVSAELDVGPLLRRGYVITFVRRESGGFAARLSWVRLYSEGGRTLPPCDGLELRWAPDRAVIQLPRSCMSGHHDERVRANVMLASAAHRRDRVPDAFLSFSPWVSRGSPRG